MIADPPNVNAPVGVKLPRPEGLSKCDVRERGSADLAVRRLVLEQKFFLVDRRGELSDLAEPFLWRCREAARAGDLEPCCFQAESVRNLVEITTPPGHGVEEMARHHKEDLS